MSKRSIKKSALLLTFWIALHTAALRADLIGPLGTSPITFDIDSNGLLSATGTEGGTGSLSLNGAGTRMFWYPQKAAFRAGYVDSTGEWNDSSIGLYSTAFGDGTTASGKYSFAAGLKASATGYYSVAMGALCTAGLGGSVAMGCSTTASNYFSTAFGFYSLASGYTSTAIGANTTAGGNFSTALGYGSSASGYGTTALGTYNTAYGSSSFAVGYFSVANGVISAAVGNHVTAQALDSFAIGTYNIGNGSATAWNATDPLFEVGNGTSSSAKADALVVYKNGVVAVHNTVRFNSGGDLSMGGFMAGTAP